MQRIEQWQAFLQRHPDAVLYCFRGGMRSKTSQRWLLEEAGINLGSPPGRTFRKVTLPLMMPGIVSGAIMSWVTAVNELSSSIVLYVGRTMTMPVRIYLSVLDGLFGTASALATFLLVATGIALFVVNRFVGIGKDTVVV